MGGELTDGRLYTTEWNKPGFDESKWTVAAKTSPLKDGKDVILSAQMSDPSRISESIPAVSMSDSIPKTWVVDMGKIFTGFLEAHFNGLKAGDTVRIHISDRIDKFDNFSQVHYYVARGENGELFRNNFNYFAGRYIHFTGLRQQPELKDITGYALTSAPKRTGYFECSDADYNRMYDIDRYTYEMCTNEGYSTDCPNRERLGYGAEGGWQTTWAMGLPCFSSGAFYIKNIRDWKDAMHPDGRMNHITPQNMESAGGVLYGSGFLNIAWEHYLAYGDKTVLEQIYNEGKMWLDYLNEHIYDGLLVPYNGDGYNFLGDWVGPGYRLEIGNSARSHIFNNCYYAISLDYMIQIANALGHADDAQPYIERLKKIRKRIHEKYYDPFMHSYLNGDQIRTTFPLYAGVVPEDLQAGVLEHLKADMTGAHPFFDIGSPSRYPYFRTLFAHPEFHNIIAGILSKKTCPGYGYFLETGETTWPEVWELDTHSARVHTSFVGISCWFIKGLAGIEPDTTGPGYRSFDLRPNVTDNLTYAKAGLESPYGLIESGWHKDGNKVIYDISVPTGSTANIYLPTSASRVTESKKPLAKAAGIRIAGEENGYVLIKAVSGKYRFEVE
jgi:alpha-L-rhamnosidase